MSAFLTGMLLPSSEADNVYFHAIDSRAADTWPAPEKLAPAGTPADSEAGLQRQIAVHDDGRGHCFFIDCCPTSAEYLLDIRREFNIVVIDNNPATAAIKTCGARILVVNDPTMPTISQVWQHFEMMTSSLPEWVRQVERIESWTMKGDDAAVRENLLEIARLPTMGRMEEAISATTEYLAIWEEPHIYAAFVSRGQKKLAEKAASYTDILARVQTVTLPAGKWGLPASWAGRTFLYVDTTGTAPDSSELASAALAAHPGADAFVNFRKRKNPGPDGRPIWHYIYSARRAPDSTIDLVAPGSPFKGFDKSAGGVVSSLAACIPFVSA